MPVATSLIIAGVVVAAAAAGSAYVANQANKKAAALRKKALDNVQGYNIGQFNEAAQAADAQRLSGALELQRSADPNTAALRDQGAKGLLDSLNSPAAQGADAAAANALAAGTADANDPRVAKLQSTFLQQAQSDLDAGATLPPEYQAELIRSGLAANSAAGVAPDRKGAAGQTANRLLGSAGIALANSRKQQAGAEVGAATGIAAARQSILQSLTGTLNANANAKAGRSLTAFGVGQSTVPQYGLSGADVTRLNIANQDTKNQVTLAKGAIDANSAIQQGQTNSAYIQAGAQLAGTVTSGYGAANGQNPNGGGGYGSLLSSLTSGSKSNSNPYTSGPYSDSYMAAGGV